MPNYEIDNLDLEIIRRLQENARYPFQELARELYVSGGTIRGRYKNLRKTGYISGTTAVLDREKLGFDICAFVGINLHNAKDYLSVIEKLKKIPEVLEAHYTTGKYNIFLKIVSKSTRKLYEFLIERLQGIPEIQSTETLISLKIPISEGLPLDMVEKKE